MTHTFCLSTIKKHRATGKYSLVTHIIPQNWPFINCLEVLTSEPFFCYTAYVQKDGA